MTARALLPLLLLITACAKTEAGPKPEPPAASSQSPSATPAAPSSAPASPESSAPLAPSRATASASPPPSAAPSAPASAPRGERLRDPILRGAKWVDVFAIYPGVRPLCDEHVTGNTMHIHWMSFASHDEPAAAAAFYERMHPSLAEPASPDAGGARTFRSGDKRLEIHPAGATGIPSCATKPDAKDRSILIVSQAIR